MLKVVLLFLLIAMAIEAADQLYPLSGTTSFPMTPKQEPATGVIPAGTPYDETLILRDVQTMMSTGSCRKGFEGSEATGQCEERWLDS